MIELIVPWPDRDLFPNRKNGVQWAAYQKKKEAARFAGYSAAAGLAVDHKDLLSQEEIPLEITFYSPDARHRDWDGLAGAIKNAIDGVCSGLGIDDKCFWPVTIKRSRDAAKKGYVTLKLG